MLPLKLQIIYAFILAIPIACIAWTITHEEVFREIREFCTDKSKNCKALYQRKFFYLFTCEYCFSHYITLIFLFITGYKLLFDDWRGYLVGGFSLVWIANQYMSLYNRLRLDIKGEKVKIESEEQSITNTEIMKNENKNEEEKGQSTETREDVENEKQRFEETAETGEAVKQKESIKNNDKEDANNK